ncbi:hypothetical protein BKA80DRAFT_342647 [Phyllosticta citrichinensis]
MGRIKKVATPKHDATLSPFISNFIKESLAVPLHKLPSHLNSFPRRWPFPRGDLYHWIPTLNLFDAILEAFANEYGLGEGPQAQPFERRLLLRGVPEDAKPTVDCSATPEELDSAGFASDGDRELIEHVVKFTKLLLENCGNRSLYASSEHLSKLLNTSDLSLLRTTLRLTLRLAQRYHTSRNRLGSTSTFQSGLLQSLYNIHLEKLHKIALPFAKSPSTAGVAGRAKEKSSTPTAEEGEKAHVADLVGKVKHEEISPSLQHEWGGVFLTYYETPSSDKDDAGKSTPQEPAATAAAGPSTPTPVRRTSNLGPQTTPRQPRVGQQESSPRTPATPTTPHIDTARPGPKFVEVPSQEVLSKPVHDIVQSYQSDIPLDTRYELLHRLRVAKALVSDRKAREDIVAVRLLAIANLAYVQFDPAFHQKIGQQDGDEPRPLQIAYQLSELIHPPAEGQVGASRELQTVALQTLEALTKQKSKAPDLQAALSLNVNHGVLFYVARKAVSELAQDEVSDRLEDDEWRESLFMLLTNVPNSASRVGESMVAAGLFDIFVEVLKLRTNTAERYFPRVLSFFDTFAFSIRDAFQAFVTAKGLDAIADLAGYQVAKALERVESNDGMPAQYKTQHTDYAIGFYPQQTLRWLFKFISHMMTQGGGGIDRLLRNLMDSPQLLNGLRTVLSKPKVFGSTVWSMAVNILSNFIHHEPTSYSIIAEAGLPKTFLETVTQKLIPEASQSGDVQKGAEEAGPSESSTSQALPEADADSQLQQAGGILPVAEAISAVPPAFGAICLVEAGLNLFKRSTALESFFEVFTSPAHVKAIEVDGETASSLGQSFDELVRHHPTLKSSVLNSVKKMVADVGRLCFLCSAEKGVGAKLWLNSTDGRIVVAGGKQALKGKEGPLHKKSRDAAEKTDSNDVEMTDAPEPATDPAEGSVSIDQVIENEEPKNGPTSMEFITATCKFLEGFFVNDGLCSAFIEEGGLEFAIDFATLPCLPYNFTEFFVACEDLSRLCTQLVETKPHLAVPALLKRLQSACDDLEPLMQDESDSAHLLVFTNGTVDQSLHKDIAASGTKYAKALVAVITLSDALTYSLQGSIYSHRGTPNIFSQVNLADMYARVIDSLGRLHRRCIWEEILLQKEIPPDWEKATRVKTTGSFIIDEANDILRLARPNTSGNNADQTNAETDSQGQPLSRANSGEGNASQPAPSPDKSSAQYKNTQTLRFLLSQVQMHVPNFLQAVGKCLLFRRTQDYSQKQHAIIVAHQLAKLAMDQLSYEVPKRSADEKDRSAYWIVILSSISPLMIEGSGGDRHTPHMLTTILYCFMNQGGFEKLNEVLEAFYDRAKAIIATPTDEESSEEIQKQLHVALGAIKIILTLYSPVVNNKAIIDAPQTNSMTSRDRTRARADNFLPAQFLIELRMAVIKPVERIWMDTELMCKATPSIVKALVNILRTVLEGEGENDAYKRAETVPARAPFVYKPWKPRSSENLESLKRDAPEDLALEALYRCYDNSAFAKEYVNAQLNDPRSTRNPIPAYETEVKTASSSSAISRSLGSLASESDTGAEEPGSQSVVMQDAEQTTDPVGDEVTRCGFVAFALANSSWSMGSDPSSDPQASEYVRVEDLEEERVKIREDIIDRSLGVLEVHENITFDLSDLISAAAAKAPDSAAQRSEVGETIVNALVSLEAADDLRPVGKKIASYAHLLALILQEPDFYLATLPHLKENFSSLLSFIKPAPEQRGEETSPWISNVLLIVERLLAEDAQPHQIQWNPPRDDGTDDSPIAELPEPVIPFEEKQELFNAVIEVLLRIGKDETLALSVTRVLVILTRNRVLAAKLGERRNLQRLFVMIKQLSGATNDKLQGAFMLILRHIVEDEETIRQIMRTEVIALLRGRESRPRNSTGPHQMDVNNYLRHLWQYALRSPELFVEATNEKLKLVDFKRPGPREQYQLQLQEDDPQSATVDPTSSEPDQPSANVEQAKPKDEEHVKPSTETEAKEPEKLKSADAIPPIVESPDGVIHYLLCELLAYKDVNDKEPLPPSQEAKDNPTSTDVEMSENADQGTPGTPGSTSSAPAIVLPPPPQEPKKSEKSDKPVFKADQNPHYIYRCFILQCLTELLSSYNKTKVEFVTFSRQADPQATTPSKPRSTVLKYMLESLVPVGTLAHGEDMAFKKKAATSSWAMTMIWALCQKTGEHRSGKRDAKDEEEPELQFVRKFVLENSLKAFKDAYASNEPLDLKYSRLLNLADLFHRMLWAKPGAGATSLSMDLVMASQKQLARIMYEKNFITALTTAIADIDLNFPNAKRAVKYILRPIKLLTQTAIDLSLNGDISGSPGQVEEDEISTASSVTDMDVDREETPDLFRNSTLAMLDPTREEETESDDEDEEEDDELYGDEYDEEMDYEDEMEHDGDGVVSDEDEEIEGMGHIEGLPGDVGDDVEIVIEGEEGDGMMEDDDDSADMDEDDEDVDDDGPEDDDIEVMDEVTGDDMNDSLNGDEDDEWASEDDDVEDYDDHDVGDHGPPEDINNLVRILDGQGPLIGMQPEGYLDEDLDDMQDDEDEEDDEEDFDDDEIAYEAGRAEDEDGMHNMDWGIVPPPELPHFGGHRHHHHHRHGILGVNPFHFIPPAGLDRPMAYRTHRSSTGRGTADDGLNPLLQRSARPANTHGTTGPRRGGMSDWVHAMDGIRSMRLPPHPNDTAPVSFISNLLTLMGQGGHATMTQDGITVTVEGFPGDPSFPVNPFDVRRERRPQEAPSRSNVDDPMLAISFIPAVTSARWQEEGRLLFGGHALEKSLRVLNSILQQLVPPAIQAAKEREEREKKAKAEEEVRLMKELEEKKERERKEREEREAKEKAEREAAEARAAEEEAERRAQQQQTEDPGEEQAMEGVETTQPTAEAESTAAETSQPPARPRVVANIRGRDVDITELGIDLEYLEALPDDLREEVLMAQIQNQREQEREQGGELSEINREFLDALPEEIREELLTQENQARRRQANNEAGRRQGGAPAAMDMDVQTLFASMDPGLRQAVLLEQDDETLRELPPELAEEARRLGGDRRLNHIGDVRGGHRTIRRTDIGGGQQDEDQQKKSKPRPIVQMLDKAGVATLLRLMFIPQQGTARQTLNSILKDVCQNRHNRAEVISILLSILQDGSADINAVERSFAQLSLRAKQPPATQSSNQKTPQPLKRSLTGQVSGSLSTHGDMSPIMVVQQCLSTLVYLVYNNPHICSFFLCEHETAVGFKSKAFRKGKAKETKAYKYPLNALLSLLDRRLIMESAPVMEQLANLLMNITSPLGVLLKKDKEKKEDKAQAPAEASTTAQDGGSGGAAQASGAATDEAQPQDSTNAVEETAAAESSEKKTKKDDQPDDKKKARGLVPPEVPEENLRLVVHILAARECNHKSYQNTLTVINNLSAIPGAKETFGNELIKMASDLAQSILNDLDDLVSQISNAKSGTDVQGMALAKFSPASSDQTKLLRILTALDYLFDPKKADTVDKPRDSNGEGLPADQKADILATLYENPTFSSLWMKLSQCLTLIRERTNMLSVATILLPLIEVLMVVCKNTTLKDAPLSKHYGKEFVMSTPPPESRMENLFFNFTEDHRKVLNELVRQNPKLMSGSFSVLVKNSKVLEFDNKRNYFNRRLHSRSTELRQPHPTLQLSVRRDQVFLDSFKSLYFKSGDEMKYGKLSIRFHGEEGVDAGGVTREWFQVLSRQMFNPDYALFIPVASDRTTFHPNRLSSINQEHLLFFKFIGRIIGKALYEGRVLDCHFSRAVYKRILGRPVSIKDMETLDLDYYKSLLWMLENDITDVITETFSVDVEEFGITRTVDLIENGRNIPVTEDNKHEYVRLMVEHRLTGSVEEQLREFLKGFHDIVPPELISIFNEQELELLISGLPEIDVDDWKNNTEYHNYTPASPQIQWFWRAVRSFDKEERAKLLQFVTGTSKVPLNGFKELEGMNGFSKFNIHRDFGSKDRLPSSHTCFNQLDLPEYESYEQLRQQVYTAMTAGSEYFGFA